MKFRTLLALFSVAGLCVLGGAQVFLSRYVAAPEFKTLAEQHLRRVLASDISIGSIHARFFNEIELTDLTWRQSENMPLGMQASSILIRYPLTQLFSRRMRTPQAITLDGLRVEISDLNRLRSASPGFWTPERLRRMITRIRIRNGSVVLKVSALDDELKLEGIQGNFRPALNGIVSADFRTRASGLLSGAVRFRGNLDVFKPNPWIKLDLNGLSSGSKLPAQFQNVSGSMTFANHVLSIGPLHARAGVWEAVLDGKMRGFDYNPVFDFSTDFISGEKLGRFTGQVDFESSRLHGTLEMPQGSRYFYESGLRREGPRIFAEDAKLTGGFKGSGYLDFETGEYGMGFQKGMQRVTVQSSLRALNFSVGLDLDHFDFFGLDLVMSSRFSLTSADTAAGGDWTFDGDFSTDYFILEQEPFKDFKGKFRLGSSGIRDLNCAWGDVFEMSGDVHLRDGRPDAGLALKVRHLDLAKVRELAARPLLFTRGILEGKLKVEGDLRKPDVTGMFSIKDGKISRVDFDRAMIEFRGFPPYLALNNSRILRGRTTFYLEGAINLSMEYPFSGVRIETADKIILVKGLSLQTVESEGEVDFLGSLSGLASLSLSVGGQDGDSTLGASTGLSEDKYAAIGSKIKF